MGVNVDEARCNDQALGIDHAGRVPVQISYGDDLAATDSNVAGEGRLT